jgi:nickel-dependent lactate racemase
MQQTLTLPWGKNETLDLTLPVNWDLSGRLEPSALASVSDTAVETRRRLNAPIGLPRLAEMARGKTRVTVVVDDASRPTPVRQMLPMVLAELHAAGITSNQISLAPALGVHRAMTSAEVTERTGLLSLGGIQVITHDCDSPSLIRLGTTRRGSPVLVNPAVTEADLVVSIGCIEPHIIASFGGGYKNIFPGLAGRATIAHNHSLNCTEKTFNMVGQPIERNPMRLDLEEAGAMLKAPVFIVNAVLNSASEVVRVVCGHPIQAHRAGAQVSANIYGVNLAQPADVVITDSHPMDQDLRQGVKALANTVRAVRRGGVLITLVRATEGVGVFGLASRKLPLGRAALKALAPLLIPLVPKLKLKGMAEEDKFFLYFALQAMRHATLLMYAPTIPAVTRTNLPFVQFVDSPEEALAIATRLVCSPARVVAFPFGGSTYPILSS